VHLGRDQRVEKPECVTVVYDLVLVREDPEHLAGVLPQVRLEPGRRDQFGRVLRTEIIRPLRRFDHQDVAVRDLPAEAGLVECLVDRLRVLVEHDAQPVPGNLADREHPVVRGDAMRHFVILQ
jgi:hypothetical protein